MNPKLRPKDQEVTLATVCRTTPPGGEQDVDQGSKAGVEERRARALEWSAIGSTPLGATAALGIQAQSLDQQPEVRLRARSCALLPCVSGLHGVSHAQNAATAAGS